MIPVVAGLVTAFAWALATLAAARATRVLGPWSTTAWVVLFGLIVTMPLLAVDGTPDSVAPLDMAWLAMAGLGYVAGMVLNYAALSGG